MPGFIKQHKYHLVFLVILILITIVSGGYLLATDYQTNTKTSKQISQATNTTENSKQQIVNSTPSETKESVLSKMKDLSEKTPSNQKDSDIHQNDNPTLQQSNIQTLPTSTIISSCQQNCINIQIKIPLTAYSLELKAETSVYDAMTVLQTNSDFTFNGTDYSSLGFFVNEINGVKNDIKNNKFWIYYINGQSAKVGISNYKLINNDLIEWKYAESKF